MKITFIKKTLLILGAILIFISCSKEDIDNVITNTGEVQNIDKTFLAQIKKSAQEFDKNTIWKGYDFSSQPMYFIYRDANKKPLRGYLINPKKEISGAEKLKEEDANGLNVYRFDRDVIKLNKALKSGNDLFEFFYKIEGDAYYSQIYSDKTIADKFNGAIQFATHEVFHVFQFATWKGTANVIQNEEKYPINTDLLALQLLTLKISAKMPTLTNKSEIKEYLKMYVAIRNKEMSIDPTPNAMVKNMANEQEKGEGTAKFIEVMNSYKIIPDYSTAFGIDNFSSFQTKKDMRSYFAFGIWYDTGAAVSHMLKNQEAEIEEQIKAGKTLFGIAKPHLNLSTAQEAAALQAAKSEFNWANIEAEALRLTQLN